MNTKGLVKIEYPWWGNAHPKNQLWRAILPDMELLDYGSVKHLVRVCEKEGYNWQVLRHHRGGKKHKRGDITILATNLK